MYAEIYTNLSAGTVGGYRGLTAQQTCSRFFFFANGTTSRAPKQYATRAGMRPEADSTQKGKKSDLNFARYSPAQLNKQPRAKKPRAKQPIAPGTSEHACWPGLSCRHLCETHVQVFFTRCDFDSTKRFCSAPLGGEELSQKLFRFWAFQHKILLWNFAITLILLWLTFLLNFANTLILSINLFLLQFVSGQVKKNHCKRFPGIELFNTKSCCTTLQTLWHCFDHS